MGYCRQSVRLRGYDYSLPGAYFVTICAQNHECLFGEIKNGEMVLNDLGKIADTCWHEISAHYPVVILDTYMIMPNHMHGIIAIVGAGSPRPDNVSDAFDARLRTHKFNP